MIQAIGFMIGFYIITKMISLITKKPDGKEGPVATVFAAITIFITIICLISLFTAGADLSSLQY
jgi:hypothetical protein